jgi:hypothetical protein
MEPAHLAARRKRHGHKGHRHSPYSTSLPVSNPGVRSVVPGSSKGNMTVVISEGPVYVAAIANLHWNVMSCLVSLYSI